MKKWLGSTRRWLPLLLVSLLSLFIELAVIRWVSAEVRIFAYYKNLVLLAVFMGFAIGFSQSGKGIDLRKKFHINWILFVFLTILISWVTARRSLAFPGSEDEYLWQVGSMNFWLALIHFIGIVVSFFLIVMFLFIPLGQMVGEEMNLHPPVQAYIVNIIASLLGVWLYSLVSFLRTSPIMWFGISLLGIVIYYAYKHYLTLFHAGIFLISLVAIGIYRQDTIWSPYNRLNLSEFSYTRARDGKQVIMSYLLEVQNAFYQTATDLSEDNLQTITWQSGAENSRLLYDMAFAYELPFMLAKPGSHVLVVGSGMGNDVAAALRMEMAKVISVEIDPVILDLGRRLHPEKPYSSSQVNTVESDARTFFNSASGKYDLVVFGLLDSHTLLSEMSSVRLDSYVYTLNSFEKVSGLLKDDGYVSISFSTNEWIEERLGRMMATVFGEEHIYINHNVNGTTFLAGRLSPEQQALTLSIPWTPNPEYNKLPLPTDDWPYLYLREKKIPSGYWQTLLVIIVVSLSLIARSYRYTLHPDWHFWLLGAAFLLIEFKAITELALLFGTTWFVNSLAISGVLVMAFSANLFVLRHQQVSLGRTYLLLFTSILAGFLIPLESFAGLPALPKGILSTLLLSLPLLFAGVIFSESLRRHGVTSHALASNFSGSAVGGLLEYSSILWGIKSLYVLSAMLYLGAFLVSIRTKK